MKLLLSSAVCSMLLLAGCQSTSQVIAAKEDLLAGAGFSAKQATTPEQLASLKSLPANKFVTQKFKGQTVYLYADPIVCKCVYTGDQASYSKYRQMVFQQNLANEQEMTASMQENAFDFTPWGGPFGGPWGGPWGY